METLESSPGRGKGFGPVKAVARQRSGPSRQRRTATAERRLISGLAVAAAAGVAFSPATPTAFVASDVVLRAAFAVVLTLAASRARRWTWIVLAGVAVLGADGVWLAVAAVALAGAIAATLLDRQRAFGAAIGALSVQVLLRFPEMGDPMASAAVAALGAGPVLVSAYLVSPRRVRKNVHRGLLIAAGVVALGVAVLGVSTALAYSAADRGAEDAREGLDAVAEGKTRRATELLDSSASQFAVANDAFSAWWAVPARAIPGIAPQAEALRVATEQGRDVARSSAALTRQVDYETLRYRSGQIDLRQVRDAQAPLAETASTLANAVDRVGQVRSPWLLPILADQLDELHRDLQKASSEAALASSVSKEAPGLLGGDGTRRYFVAIITPSEGRGLGGFMGNWLEITASDGRLEITRSGRARDLNEQPGASQRNVIQSDADYANRYGRYRIGSFFQDITSSPDLPTVAKVINELYPKAGGAPIDGALAVDPTGLAALLELTGPVTVTGMGTPLNSANAAEFLTKGQYIEFPNRDIREDFLDEASRKTFEKLLRGDLPGPKRLADVLSPVVEQRRIMFTSLTEHEQALLERVGASGAFPKADGADFFSLRSQDRTNSKIDMFLERRVNYTARLDPSTGALQARATIALTNGAPATGLPDSIIGSNDQGLPKGTNVVNLSFYTPHRLRRAELDGQPTGLGYERELGYSVYSTIVSLPPGATKTLNVDLDGKLSAGSTYSLTVAPQPMVIADSFVATVETTVDYRFSAQGSGAPNFVVQAGATQAVLASNDQRVFRASVGLVQR